MSLHSSIRSWAKERPKWQQDALRRLVDQDELQSDDFAELASLCKAEHGVEPNSTLVPRSLEADTDVEADRAESAVVLRAVRDLQNVNALWPDQELNIEPDGITVVYGDNGAGKSGYVRVIKQLCRARGARDQVIPNVYDGNDQPTSGTLEFSLGADAQPPVLWTPGCTAPAWLDQISIFDSRSAAVYVTAENPVAYLPHGMDLFPRLASALDQVRLRLEGELGDLQRGRDMWADFDMGTAVRERLSRLGEKGARAEVARLAKLSDADRQNLQDLRAKDKKFKSENPTARAEALRLCAKRVSGVRQRLTALQRELSSSSLAGMRQAQEALAAARQAAEVASAGVFAATPVPGVSSPAWYILWDAARSYAESLPDSFKRFPPIAGDLCGLCHQPINADAAARMAAFEEFVKGKTEQAVKNAARLLDAKRQALAGIRPETVADKNVIDEIATIDQELHGLLVNCIESLTRLHSQATSAIDSGQWDALETVPAPVESHFERVVKRIEGEAADFDRATNQEELRAVENALRELAAREKLSNEMDRVDAAITREERCHKLDQCIRAASTASVTRKNKELLAEIVTAPLAAEFARQMEALRMTHVPIVMEATRGEKGKALHALQLGTSKSAAGVSADKVLSEGEHRCIALAAFFAEVSLQNSASMLVFDDPVSSLDHGRRQYVARRLAEIGLTRPVLVFTHDLVFLWMLHGAAEETKVALHPRLFRRDRKHAGLVAEEWPWDGQKVKTRLGALRERLAQLKKTARLDRASYDNEVRLFYGGLRDTWERAVEEILLQNGLRRFGKEIKTQSFRKLHRLTEAHMKTLDEGMTKASDWISGHDHSPELAVPVPEPEEAETDLQTLEQWVKDVLDTYR